MTLYFVMRLPCTIRAKVTEITLRRGIGYMPTVVFQ